MSAKLGLLAASAGLAALVVALVMPLTQPESMAALASHPLGGAALNASAAAVRAFGRLLAGAPLNGAAGPSLRDYYPLDASANSNAIAGGAAAKAQDASAAEAELDWADPRVWEAQQSQIQDPYYTHHEIAALLHWCRGNASAKGGSLGDSDGSSSGGGQRETEEVEAAEQEPRFRRLAEWVAANGGDTSRVVVGQDARGVRGLHAAQAIPAGEIALAVPLRLGLSIATFRAARAAAGPTASWRGVEDADLYLDALALSYEIAVHGERSPWADYICMLPRTYGGLPVHASDPDAASLLSALPSLRRPAAKRRAQLALVGERLAAPALEALPGGRAAMARLRHAAAAADGSRAAGAPGNKTTTSSGMRRDLWWPLWHWAVAASKTRSVALGAEELRAGGGAGAPGEGGLPFRMPLAMLEWLQEVGVMLPLLDLANHAFEGEGANVAYQLLPAPSGGGLAACLVARAAIPAGQPLLFDYVASAEEEAGPACPDRWLLEYGFVPESSDPRRDCDAFHVTATELAAAVRGAAGTAAASAAPAGLSAASREAGLGEATVGAGVEAGATTQAADSEADLEAQMRARLVRQGLPGRLEIQVRQPDPGENLGEPGQDDYVQQRWAVVHWLAAVLSGGEEEADGWPDDRNGSKSWTVDADSVLRALLEARQEQLGVLEERAPGGTSAENGVSGGGGGAELRRGVAAVAAAGRRSVRRALHQEQERARGHGRG